MASAIPIPSRTGSSLQHQQTTPTSTTPSLQSILDQRKCSLKSCASSFTHHHHHHHQQQQQQHELHSPSSLPSLISLSSLDSSDSHPLESFTLLDEIDHDFFNYSQDVTKLQILQPIHSTPTLREVASDEFLPEKNNGSASVKKNSSFVSNLTQSIRNFTNSTIQQNNDLLFGIQPRLTDDRIPMTGTHISQDQELETYKITARAATMSSSKNSPTPIIRHREPRINSQFLRLYSHECSSRKKGLLPEISTDEENEILLNGRVPRVTGVDDIKSKEFALFVRQKLWSCVVLPPKEEDFDVGCVEYVNTGADTATNDSLVDTGKRNIKPWVKFEDEEAGNVMGPRGRWGDVQYIVKGWSNVRFVCDSE